MATTPGRRPLVLLGGTSPAVEARLRQVLVEGGFEVEDAAAGAPGQPAAALTDLDGLAALAATAAAARAALVERNAQLAGWADRSAHDLMTPLAVISGMAETLQASWDRLAEADRGRLLESIGNQAARATAMLEEGLAIARPATPDS